MKINKISMIPLLLAPLLVGGCGGNNNPENKVSLNYGQYINNMLTTINYGELDSMLKDGKSFLLAIEPNSGCTCWTRFEAGALKPFISKHHTYIYHIMHDEFYQKDGSEKDLYGLDLRSDRETFSVFNNGVIKSQKVYDSKEKMWTNLDAFEDYLLPLVNLPNIFYISKDQLDRLYKTKNTNFTVLFGYDKCYDCSYSYRTILKRYSTKHYDMKPLLIVDVDAIKGLRVFDEEGKLTPESQIKWQEFKDKYGLTPLNNPKYGYANSKGAGFVPSLFRISSNGVNFNGDIIKSGAVIFNDMLSKNETSNEVYVAESYYSQERKDNLTYLNSVDVQVIEGISLNPNDYVEYPGYGYIWDHDSASKYYEPIINAFLDESLKENNDNLIKVLDSSCNTL